MVQQHIQALQCSLGMQMAPSLAGFAYGKSAKRRSELQVSHNEEICRLKEQTVARARSHKIHKVRNVRPSQRDLSGAKPAQGVREGQETKGGPDVLVAYEFRSLQ